MKTNSKPQSKKLTFSKETFKTLTVDELGEVIGGNNGSLGSPVAGMQVDDIS